MKRDWLWDRKTKLSVVKKALNDPGHADFIMFASLLFARNNEPGRVFKEYMDPQVFCRHWPRIKKAMRKDSWNSQRVVFWQAVYEKLMERYRKEGVPIRQKREKPTYPICSKAGDLIRQARKARGLSQKDLARKMKVSQQLISRIEKGKENISLLALNNVCQALGKEIDVKVV